MKINVDLVYPIGSIYITTNTVDPSVLFGGKWERYAAGRCLVGYQSGDNEFGTVGKTGGEKTHTLTVQELASHTHYVSAVYDNTPTGGNNFVYSYNYVGDISMSTTPVGNTGNNQPHNNLQPYVVVYMYRRIS